MEKLRLFWKYRVNDMFPAEILNRLLKDEIIESCIIETCNIDYEYIKQHKEIQAINRSIGWFNRYEELVDWNDVPALSQDIMEAMLPYESMAIKLGIRRVNFPVNFYETEKEQYLRDLRFWNYIFEKYMINAVYFITLPHCQHDYVIYGLAKIKNIKMIVSTPCSLSTNVIFTYVYGKDIESLGENIRQEYNNAINVCDDTYQLEGVIRDFYELHAMTDIEDIKKIENPGNDKITKQMLKENTKIYFGQYIGWNRGFLEYKQFLRLCAKSIIKRENHLKYYDIRRWTIRNVVYFKRHFMCTQKQYNIRAGEVNYDSKYIYFALQFTPEETIIPRAGVFSEQYTSIQLLARCVKDYNIMVYVKEHPHLYYRDRRFYEEVGKIDNVKFIKTTESTYDIMNHSIAVATQNGTCILEAILMKKPAIVFGDGYLWNGMPGLFQIRDEKRGKDIIKEIINGYEVNLDLVKKYFYSIQKSTITYKLKDPKDDGSTIYDKETINKNIDLIRSMYLELNTSSCNSDLGLLK